MKKQWKIFASVAVILGLVFVTGCSKESKDEGKTTGSETNEISLSVWGYDQNTEFKALVEGFEKEYDAKVKIVDIDPGSYQDKITTMLASGDKTDVLSMKDVGSYVNYANKKQLLDLTDYADKLPKEQLENYNGTLEGYRTDDKKIYALPFRKDTYVLFYNKKIFDEAGIGYPKELTWESYEALAAKLTSGKNEAEKIYGTYHHKWFPINQALAANQTDNDLLAGDYGFLADYYKTFLSIQKNGDAMDYATIKTTNTTYSSVFETEKTAMMIMGSFYVSGLLKANEAGDANVEWAMTAVPQQANAKEVITYGGPAGMGVNKNAKNPELARKFVEYCSGEDGAEILANIGITTAYQTPAVMDKLFAIKGMPTDEESKKALSPDVNGFEYAASGSAAEITKVLGEEHDLIMVGDQSIEDGIAAMEKRISGLK